MTLSIWARFKAWAGIAQASEDIHDRLKADFGGDSAETIADTTALYGTSDTGGKHEIRHL